MKRLTLLAVTFSSLFSLSAQVNASASEDVSGAFQWVGTVPANVPGTNWKIINSGTQDHLNGTVTFKESAVAGEFEIIDSSALKFTVVDGGNSDAAAASFDYELTKLQFSAGGGFMADVDTATPEFSITGNGTELTAVVSGASGDVELKVITKTSTAAVSAGDEVVIQAVILVNNQA